MPGYGRVIFAKAVNQRPSQDTEVSDRGESVTGKVAVVAFDVHRHDSPVSQQFQSPGDGVD